MIALRLDSLLFGYVQWFSELDILLLEKVREINKQIKNGTMVLRHENTYP